MVQQTRGSRRGHGGGGVGSSAEGTGALFFRGQGKVLLDEVGLALNELGQDDLGIEVRVQRVAPVADGDAAVTLAAAGSWRGINRRGRFNNNGFVLDKSVSSKLFLQEF